MKKLIFFCCWLNALTEAVRCTKKLSIRSSFGKRTPIADAEINCDEEYTHCIREEATLPIRLSGQSNYFYM